MIELSPNHSPKSREQRKAERLSKLEKLETFKIRGETRGWQPKRSQYIYVWQFFPGGRHQPPIKQRA